MIDIEKIIVAQEYRDIDIEIGKMLASLSEQESDLLVILGATISLAISNGDSCIFIEDLNNIYPYDWHRFLESLESSVCSINEQNPISPIVVSGSRVYFQRYFIFERELELQIRTRSQKKVEFKALPAKLSELSKYFRFAKTEDKLDYQMLSVFMAAFSSFFIISGGPGTGKTTVIASLLALEVLRKSDIKIALCAPTGKAQNRMKESIANTLDDIFVDDDVKQKIKDFPCSTIHSLIYRCPKGEMLPYDLVVVDECSMIPLELAAKLFRVLSPECRVIFLGDKDQLASVESGAILGDICKNANINSFSNPWLEAFEKETLWHVPEVNFAPKEFDGNLAELQRNYRFESAREITNVASSIRHFGENIEETMDVIGNALSDNFNIEKVLPKDFESKLSFIFEKNFFMIMDLARTGGRDNLAQAFKIMQKFKILCAVKKGPYGSENLNEIARKILNLRKKYQEGSLLMVTQNDRATSLNNGDCGIVWRNHQDPTQISVYFDTDRCYSLSELPPHEDVFAMTVHKSQGSGFEKVLFILSDKDNPICTRELSYTAITRAEKQVTIWGDIEILKLSLSRKTQRKTGLFKTP